jgi:hypothetical protein
MKRPLLIIGCYLNTDAKKQILYKNLCVLKDSFDIVLTTHYPIGTEFQQLVTHIVYDSVNDIPTRETIKVWFDYQNYYIENYLFEVYNPSYSVYRQIRNALRFTKEIEYDSFFYMEGDIVVNRVDIDKILELQSGAIKENKSATFFKVKNEPWWDCWLFYSEIDFFLHNTPKLSSSAEFTKYCERIGAGNFLESFLYHLLHFPHTHKTKQLEMKVEEYMTNSLVSLTSVNDADKPHLFSIMYFDETSDKLMHYSISLLKLENTNEVFVTYKQHTYEASPVVDLYINDMLVLDIKNIYLGHIYAKYTGSDDVLRIKLVDSGKIMKEYSVTREQILSSPDFIKLK